MPITTVPAAPSLPTPPSTTSPADFDIRADTFLSALAGSYTTDMTAIANATYNNAVSAYDSASNAGAAEAAAAGHSSDAAAYAALAQSFSGATQWNAATNYATGDVVWSPTDGQLYRRQAPGGVDATDPVSAPSKWYALSARYTPPLTLVNTNTTIATGIRIAKYVLTADGITLTLPATPGTSDVIYVVDQGPGVTKTSVVGRNGSNIEGLAENLTIDAANASFSLTYSDATRGWVIG